MQLGAMLAERELFQVATAARLMHVERVLMHKVAVEVMVESSSPRIGSTHEFGFESIRPTSCFQALALHMSGVVVLPVQWPSTLAL